MSEDKQGVMSYDDVLVFLQAAYDSGDKERYKAARLEHDITDEGLNLLRDNIRHAQGCRRDDEEAAMYIARYERAVEVRSQRML